MSLWTYFGGFVVTKEPIPENYFGKELEEIETPDYYYAKDHGVEEYHKRRKEISEYNLKEWEKLLNNPSEYLPYGSEGTLHYKRYNEILNYTFLGEKRVGYVTKIGGSLRDYSESQFLCDWFRDCVKDFKDKVVQAYVSAESDLSGNYLWRYQSIGMDEKFCLK